MSSARLRTRGFTLIATLLLLLLLSGIAIGLMMMVTTENKVGGVDLQNNVAYHNAEGGVEKMTSDLAAAFKSAQSPKASDICALSSLQPVVPGVTWKDYQVQPASGCTAALANNYGQISSGMNQGLYAQIIPVTMLATAAQAGGQEVSMMRTAQVALIPVFQFGIFCDNDCSFFSGPNFDFAGRVHTNGDLYPEVGNGSFLVFHDRVTSYGNVIRQQLANGFPTATNYAGTVLMPTQSQGCDGAPPAPVGTCRALTLAEGSVLGAGGNPPQSGNNTNWPNVSLSSYNSEVMNGNFGITPPGGTGAKNLQLPFVNGTDKPYEIVRRARAGDSSGLSSSREYNMAQIQVLISDDPAELPAGAIRLANVAPYQFGVPAPVSGTSFPGNVAPALPAGSTYNTYFAASTQALPDESPCNNAACGNNSPLPAPGTGGPLPIFSDWPLNPAAHPPGDNVQPANAPIIANAGAAAPPFTLCPPANTFPAGPANCPAAPTSPYYLANNALPYPLPANAATWNLLDGWLSVRYKDPAGAWHDVTKEWLELGFARGTVPPGAPGANPVNPSAILIMQQPADRNGDGNPDPNGIAPLCTHVIAAGVNKGKCDKWNYGLPPEVVSDFVALTAGSTSPYFGIVNGGVAAAQSVSMYNWYPINLYDAREGEPRDVAAGNNSCAAAGVMNAVEIDMGNLKQWLWGAIGASGTNADFVTQNGWVLYFSDRRGMLPNPNPTYNGVEKSGDSGLEDSINTSSGAGVPDGVLEPKAPGRQFSPEDVNQNNAPDFFGSKNIGLGFWNGGVNVNGQVTAGTANPYIRINSCLSTGRKNWVSGARHALKLVDAAFGNIPYRQDGTLASPGGLTVASENPVYIQGDYNSNAGDPAWGGGADLPGHAAASVIADSVTLLSRNWGDLNSFANPTSMTNRNAGTTYYRLAIAGGKNMNFPKPAWGGNDYGTDGGVHNFLRYLEDWGGQTLNYKGSMVSLYYSTYLTGVFKCCTVVYSPPVRNYSFDADFALPGGLPPGTPMFRDVDTLGYRQVFAVRDK